MATATARRAAPKKVEALITISLPTLGKGEKYAGFLLDEKGAPTHHVVLLPGHLESAKWDDAMKWAKKQGGELPSRREQSLLFANNKADFQERYYWSAERPAGLSGYAWGQYFGNGDQYGWHKGSADHARAVRRIPIK